MNPYVIVLKVYLYHDMTYNCKFFLDYHKNSMFYAKNYLCKVRNKEITKLFL